MLLTVLAYAMIIVFMYVVMTKKMSPFTSLVLVPLVFAAVLIITGSADLASDAKFVSFVGEEGSVNGLTAIGDMVLYGVNTTAKTGIMLLFAILYFSIARAMSVLGVGAEILGYLAPGMILSLLYVTLWVAPSMGRKERARLGVVEFTEAELKELTDITDPDTLAIRRPKNFVFNAILTIVLIGWLVAGSFIETIELAPLLLFAVGTVIALMVNYPVLKDQSKRIGDNAGDAVQVVILVFAAGIFMGLFQGSGMATALANSFATIIPKQLAGFWGLIIALVSAPGTFFISNDGFYYGILPVMAEAGASYGFTPEAMALASLMGQAFHLLSPLVAFIYLLLRLTGLDMGEWQKESAKYAAVIFIIFVITIIATGHMPLYIPQ
ncbi:SLC13 family permease [Streptococcus hillyeri]|uniref:Citrate transporter n=1 Tax=Streptococcus hillyeri TaxID=2282420 RepID=A0A3L9DZI0_9STRE|nr:SLC13 family permease [Streptococcus hillyeri]RLY05383.1 citrate transporter [Streptococcus hillyeri]